MYSFVKKNFLRPPTPQNIFLHIKGRAVAQWIEHKAG